MRVLIAEDVLAFGNRCISVGHKTQIAICTRSPKTAAHYVPLDELVQLSDIVTLHTPLNADTRHLLNRQRIGQMKHGAFIINTGRGACDVVIGHSPRHLDDTGTLIFTTAITPRHEELAAARESGKRVLRRAAALADAGALR